LTVSSHIHTYAHTHIHTYTHTHIHTYTHTHIHTGKTEQLRQAKQNNLDNRTALSFIFCMTLLSNNGVLRVIPNALINLFAIVVWIVASFGLDPDVSIY